MKKALFLFVMFVMPFALQAQTKYHDVEANDAKGAVKSLTVSVMGQEQKTDFTEDGKMQSQALTDAVYDDNGYIKSSTLEINGMKIEVKYEWENGKVKSQSTGMMGQQMKTTNVYNEKGEVVKQIIDMGGQQMTAEYSDYKYDDKGNWISRKTNIMGQSMDTPRTVEYY